MSGDPIWYFFVIPVALLTLQLIVLAIVLAQMCSIKRWWIRLFTDDNYKLTLPSAQETRARQLQHSKERELYTKEKLLSQATLEE